MGIIGIASDIATGPQTGLGLGVVVLVVAVVVAATVALFIIGKRSRK